MPQNKNPGPLAGGHGAVTLHVNRTVVHRKSLKVQVEQRLRREHLARQLHRSGNRVVFEFIDEIARTHDLGNDLDRRLEGYALLDPKLLRAVGADRFAPIPLHGVTP